MGAEKLQIKQDFKDSPAKQDFKSNPINQNHKTSPKPTAKANSKNIEIKVNRKFNNEFPLSEKLFTLFQRQLSESENVGQAGQDKA